MLTVVCFLWKGRGAYTAQHVNVLRSMLKRHLTVPHELVCVTDDGAGVHPEVRIVAIDQSLMGIGKFADAYPKLMVYRPDAAALFGERILVVDIDVVIVRNIDHLVNRDEDIVFWRDVMRHRGKGFWYNSSLLLMTAGTRTHVWNSFSIPQSPDEVVHRQEVGSDQAWARLALGEDEAVWERRDGVASFKHDVLLEKTLRDDVSVVVFHGQPKAWEPFVMNGHPWILEHWR